MASAVPVPPLVARAVAPRIAVYASEDVQRLCQSLGQDGGFGGLGSLLQQFQDTLERITVRTSTYESQTLTSFPLLIDDHSAFGTTTSDRDQDEVALDEIGAYIQENSEKWTDETPLLEVRVDPGVKKDEEDEEESVSEGSRKGKTVERDEGWSGRSIERLAPWYAYFRDAVFARRPVTEHDTFNHPVACFIAVSTANPDPLNAFAQFYDQTSKEKLFGDKPYMDPNILRYYVLVHDVSNTEIPDYQELLDSIKRAYGLHCAVLPINAPNDIQSQKKRQDVFKPWGDAPLPALPGLAENPSPAPGPSAPARQPNLASRAKDLSAADQRVLKMFVREFAVQSLIPYMEKCMYQWNEQLAVSRRGITGRLFSAGRKYFGSTPRSGSPVSGTSSNQSRYDPIKGFYPHSSQEAQSRKLADFAFVLRDFRLAASTYDMARKDFGTDKAWRYYAAASRMAGLCHLLLSNQSSSKLDAHAYLEQAMSAVYSNGLRVSQFDSTKAIIFYYEVHTMMGDFRSAPLSLIRTANVAEDFTGAILLEQAAMCYLFLPRPAKRKYAFQMVMASQKYEQSGQKKMCQRCLLQAVSVYRGHGWHSIRDRVLHTLGRIAYNMGRSDDALDYFTRLLVTPKPHEEAAGESHEAFLNDLALAYEHLGDIAEEVVEAKAIKLPQAVFDSKHAFIRLTQENTLHHNVDSTGWAELEETFLDQGFKDVKGTRRKRPDSLRATNEGNVAIIGETFYLELRASNPLNAAIVLTNLKVQTSVGGDPNESEEGGVIIDAPPEVHLSPLESLQLYIPIRITQKIACTFTAITYRFNRLIHCTESLTKQGKRLNATQEQRLQPTYAQDTSLRVKARSPIPTLTVSLNAVPARLVAGELVPSEITVTNTGQNDLVDLRLLCTLPTFFYFGEKSSSIDPYPHVQNDSQIERKVNISNQLPLNTPFDVPLPQDPTSKVATLIPGASQTFPVLCYGDFPGQHSALWLFVFRSSETEDEYLTYRCATSLDVLPALYIRPSVKPPQSGSLSCTIGLEVDNVNVVDPIEITQITTLSPNWKASPLRPTSVGSHLLRLPYHQTEAIFFSIEPANHSDQSIEGHAVEKLTTLLGGKNVQTNFPPNVELNLSTIASGQDQAIDSSHPLILSTFRSARGLMRETSLSDQYPSISHKLLPHIFTLISSRSLDLIVFFSIPSRNVRGHHVLPLKVGASRNLLKGMLADAEVKAGGLYAESQRERTLLMACMEKSELGLEERPMVVAVEVEQHVRHDFGQGPCEIPVVLALHNVSPFVSVEFTLELGLGIFEPRDPSSPPSPTPALWASDLIHQGEIAPLKSAEVNAKVWAPHKGAYDVGGWRVYVKACEGPENWVEVGRTTIVYVSALDGGRALIAREAEAVPGQLVEASA